MNKMKVKTKDLESPWITKGIKKSCKKKQGLYSKFLKKRNEKKKKKEYQDYKKLFESIKKLSKKLFFSKLILKYKSNIKKTWQVIKEAIGKEKYEKQNVPKKVLVNKISITETESIAESFNKYFTQIGPKLTKDIDTLTNEYIKKHDTTKPEKVISVDELKDAFFSLNKNKSTRYDDISFNVVKKCFGVLHKPLLHIFNLSLQTGIFPDKPKIARVTPLFKEGENYELGNYRPISVLPCFSKILEKVMCNRLYKYLTDNSMLYKKQFGFQEGHSTEHA